MNEVEFGGWYVDDDGVNFLAMIPETARLRVLLTSDALCNCLDGTLATIGETFEANQRVIAKAALDRFWALQEANNGTPHVFTLDREWMDRYVTLRREYHAGAVMRLIQTHHAQEALVRARIDESSVWVHVERANAQYLKDGSLPPAELTKSWHELRSKTEQRYQEWLSALSGPTSDKDIA